MGEIRRSRSKGREKSGFEPNAADYAADHGGIGYLRKQASQPRVLSDSLFAAEHRPSKPKKAGGTPMKMLIDEELYRDANTTHKSPGVIGRLMGLDSLPSFGVHSQHKYTECHSQKMSPGSSHDRYGSSEDNPRRRSTDEMPELKDVFEVMEATRMKMQQSPKSRNGNVSSKLDDADMDFIKQKFMDAKRLSTDESLQRSKEFNDALEALVSNRDLLLEFLQEPNPVLARDLLDLSCSPSSNANQITILKPSRRNKFTDVDIVYPQEKGTESSLHMPKEVKHSSRKHYANFSSQFLKEDSDSLRQKLSRSSHQESIDKCICPTRIVVLKPSLEKAQNIEEAFPLTHEIFHSGYRRHKTCQHVSVQGLRTEEFMRQMSSGDSEDFGTRAKGSREIAREITKQMRRASRGSRGGKSLLIPEMGAFDWDERLSSLSSMAKLKASEALHKSSDLHDAWNPPSFSSLPTYSTETSVSKQARKHLSDRWKMTRQYQHPAPDANGFSTLGDMLALSDREASKVASGSMPCQKCPKGELHRDGMPGSRSHPLCISSNDGWKDESASNLTRSKSLPSSVIRGNTKSSIRKRSGRHSEFSMLKDVLKAGLHDYEDSCHSRQRRSWIPSSALHCDEADVTLLDEEESTVIEREIHVNSEEPMISIAMPETSQQKLLYPAQPDHELVEECCLDIGSAIPEWQEEAQSPTTQNQHMQHEPASPADDWLLVPSLDDLATQAEGIAHHEGDDNPALRNPSAESESPVSSKDDDRLSPVSVLESSLDTDDEYSGGFEKISSDLQELRMQLRLLKRETTDSVDETELLILSDDEFAAPIQPLPEMEEISPAFRDEKERNFSYLVDMLIDLGIHGANQDELLNACNLSECPASIDLYDRLEKKYSNYILWPQSERKLLFDLTNAVLADIVASLMQHGSQGMAMRCWPKWDQEGFVEEVWQRVVRQWRGVECSQENRSMDVGWFGSENGIDLVGSEICSMLQEDLLEEIMEDSLEDFDSHL